MSTAPFDWHAYLCQQPSTSADVHVQLEREFACDHPLTKLTFKDSVNGARTFRIQCMRCGDRVQNVKAAELSDEDKFDACTFDDDLHVAWHEQRLRRHAEIRQEYQSFDSFARTSRYTHYLASPEWAAKRQAVLARDGELCQGCRVAPATQAHHLTYDRIGREMLFDLISVCAACHDQIHGR